MLAAPGGGQFTQQIILPANFQNLKTLQGLKVIPMGQQGETKINTIFHSIFRTFFYLGSSDRVFTARVMTSTANSTLQTAKTTVSTPTSQETVKE